jgi:hypothetical protein
MHHYFYAAGSEIIPPCNHPCTPAYIYPEKEFVMKHILIIILILALATLACGVNFNLPISSVTPGPEQTDQIHVDNPSPSETANLTLAFGAGKLNLAPGDEAYLVDGTAIYNIPDFKPTVTTVAGQTHVEQGNYTVKGFPNFENTKNTWDLKLGQAPMSLTINAGAYQGRFELGGLSLTSLTVQDGAADVKLAFSQPNQTEMSVLRYETGASNVTMSGLANANLSTLIFKSGAGNYTLDFNGKLERNMAVTIETGLSNLSLVIPQDIPTSISVDGGLANVNTPPDWSQSGNTYSQSGSGPSLTIIIKAGAGNVAVTH